MINLGNHAVYRYIKAILEGYFYCKNVTKSCSNKNLIMFAGDEERLLLSNKCWICDKLFDVGDNKARDHCHITGKYRSSTHWSCNINLKIIYLKIVLIFYNLRGYESHLIIMENR